MLIKPGNSLRMGFPCLLPPQLFCGEYPIILAVAMSKLTKVDFLQDYKAHF